jgi:hypothetical protein
MSQEVFDDTQLTAMTRAINQIMVERPTLQRDDVAHAVFILASDTGEFDAAVLARLALESLARPNVSGILCRAEGLGSSSEKPRSSTVRIGASPIPGSQPISLSPIRRRCLSFETASPRTRHRPFNRWQAAVAGFARNWVSTGDRVSVSAARTGLRTAGRRSGAGQVYFDYLSTADLNT